MLKTLSIALLVTILFFGFPPALIPIRAQRFGMDKVFDTRMKVTLKRKLPPRVYLTGKRINVRVTTRNNGWTHLTAPMTSVLESELFSHDNQLVPVDTNPESII